MDHSNYMLSNDPNDYIARALVTEGAHLAVGRGGATLHFGEGAYFSTCDAEPLKNACIKAGLPVIDSRNVAFEVVVNLALNGPMVAVGRKPCDPPYHPLSYAPLEFVAESYRQAGAMVWNQFRIR